MCFTFYVCHNIASSLYRYVLLKHCYLCLVPRLRNLQLRESISLFQFFVYSMRLIVLPKSRCAILVSVTVHLHVIVTLRRHQSIHQTQTSVWNAACVPAVDVRTPQDRTSASRREPPRTYLTNLVLRAISGSYKQVYAQVSIIRSASLISINLSCANYKLIN